MITLADSANPPVRNKYAFARFDAALKQFVVESAKRESGDGLPVEVESNVLDFADEHAVVLIPLVNPPVDHLAEDRRVPDDGGRPDGL